MPALEKGFLLSHHSFDQDKKAHIQFWALGEQGPLLLNIAQEKTLFFIKRSDKGALQKALIRLPHHV